jgi:hypothetical protein
MFLIIQSQQIPICNNMHDTTKSCYVLHQLGYHYWLTDFFFKFKINIPLNHFTGRETNLTFYEGYHG